MSIRAYIVLKTECEIDELDGEEVLKILSMKHLSHYLMFHIAMTGLILYQQMVGTKPAMIAVVALESIKTIGPVP